jgi:hexosaminidase
MFAGELLKSSKFAMVFGVGALVVSCTAPATVTTTTTPTPAVSTPQLVPMPASMQLNGGAPFEITRTTSVTTSGGNADVAALGQTFAAFLRKATEFPLAVSEAAAAGSANTIDLRLGGDATALGDEGYNLTVTPSSVQLVANTPAGLFRGVQTIRQLLPTAIESEIGSDRSTWTIPAVSIVDRPRFAWRGAMLDVSRHFFTVREVEEYIDLMALYKLNTLHLHLSDDQGWRIQINSRPKLTEIGSQTQVGGGPGGFYTQQQYQDIIRYAAARYITIVPEIDMPAHTNAALAAYPEVSCSDRPAALYTGTDVGWSSICTEKEESYALIDDVVREIAAITPGPFFHVGGDEVKLLTDQQYTHFIERVQDIVNRHGKRMIGWEEIYKAHLKPTSVVQSWKGDSAAQALKYGSKLVLSPAKKAYIDMKYNAGTELGLSWAALIEVSDAYDWDPATYNPGVTERDVLGIEAPMWSETLRNIGAVEFLAMPRLAALAEVAWTPQAARDWQNFRVRLASQAPRWRYMGVNYYHSPQIPW